jgi:hypothetical protein
MNTTSLSDRKAVPVVIRGITLYCENFKAVSVRNIVETSTSTGNMAITSNASRSTKLIFTGRICSEDAPADALFSFNAFVNLASPFNVTYMGLTFNNCYMSAYSFTDKGGDWIDVSVTLITADDITRSDAI